METNLAAIKTALADMSDRELGALIEATYSAPQLAPGLLAWVDSACMWETQRRGGYDFELQPPEAAIPPEEDAVSIDAADALRTAFAKDSPPVLQIGHGVDIDYYHGTLEDLVAATGLPASTFPGQPGQNKTCVTIRSPRRIWIDRSGPQSFNVRIAVGVAEANRRKKRHEREEAAAEAAKLERKMLRNMATSATHHRKRALSTAKEFVDHMEIVLGGMAAGYRFDDETEEELREAFAQILALLEHGTIRFDPDERACFIEFVRRETMGADPAFQRFVKTVTRRGKGAPGEPAEPSASG